jgi:hypothetical protein
MKSWWTPTPEQIDRTVALLAQREHHRHFFDLLENPEWLGPQEKKGFLKSPPPPIPDESRGAVAFPVWPESRYLARMSKLAPEKVAQILRTIPDTENLRVHDDLADAALAMPAELAAEFVPKVINWIQSPFHALLPEKLGALFSRLASSGEVDSALELAKAILAIRADPRNREKVRGKQVPVSGAAASFPLVGVQKNPTHEHPQSRGGGGSACSKAPLRPFGQCRAPISESR